MQVKTISLIGALMAGDAIAFLVAPKKQTRTWDVAGAPKWYHHVMKYLRRHPKACRAIAVAELSAGVALLRRRRR